MDQICTIWKNNSLVGIHFHGTSTLNRGHLCDCVVLEGKKTEDERRLDKKETGKLL